MIYAANHRGTKENDLLLGDFAKNKLETLSEEDQHLFFRLLEESDGDIYDWFLLSQQEKDKTHVPSHYQALLHQILSYHAQRL